jgi:hypothetical protein
MLYAAKCFWPGVAEEDVRLASVRASSRAPSSAFRGALYLPADELVLCLFEAESAAVVKRESERAGMPCERVIETVWITPRNEGEV